MRYKLERNKNGMITQCENNADGNNIYTQREEINKIALENLKRPTPGKLGYLSNLQLFNFRMEAFASGSDNIISEEYNTTNEFPANCTETIMFGVDGLNNKALYYNIKSVNCNVFSSGTGVVNVLDDSYVEFYTLQNIETSTTSLGTKIPQPSPLYGNGGTAVVFTTTGAKFGHQSISASFDTNTVSVPESEGIRASGLALKTIRINFTQVESLANIKIFVNVFVDTSSVSTTY